MPDPYYTTPSSDGARTSRRRRKRQEPATLSRHPVPRNKVGRVNNAGADLGRYQEPPGEMTKNRTGFPPGEAASPPSPSAPFSPIREEAARARCPPCPPPLAHEPAMPPAHPFLELPLAIARSPPSRRRAFFCALLFSYLAYVPRLLPPLVPFVPYAIRAAGPVGLSSCRVPSSSSSSSSSLRLESEQMGRQI